MQTNDDSDAKVEKRIREIVREEIGTETGEETRARQEGPVNPLEKPMRLTVRVREIQHDAAKDDDAREDGMWIRIFPIKKLCNPRYDETFRGEY